LVIGKQAIGKLVYISILHILEIAQSMRVHLPFADQI